MILEQFFDGGGNEGADADAGGFAEGTQDILIGGAETADDAQKIEIMVKIQSNTTKSFHTKNRITPIYLNRYLS